MATKAEPIVAPAPARFSTTMLWPSCGESCSNTTRGMMSVVLPAPTGTIARSGFVGHVSAPASIVANPSPSTGSSIRQIGFMTSSLSRIGSAREDSGIHGSRCGADRGLAVQYLIPLAIYTDPA